MLGTGGSSSAVTKILIDNGVKEDNILFLNVLGCSEGLWVLKKSISKIKSSNLWSRAIFESA